MLEQVVSRGQIEVKFVLVSLAFRCDLVNSNNSLNFKLLVEVPANYSKHRTWNIHNNLQIENVLLQSSKWEWIVF